VLTSTIPCWALLDPEIVKHWKTLPEYPWVVATPTEVKVIDDGEALFDRHPKVQEYDDYYVGCMLNDAKRGQTGIGYVVNAITWFNLLWLNRESIVAELRRMQPSPQIASASLWMEQELPRSRMPMVASRLEEIIDAIKLNGSSINWASGVITEFRNTCPVAPKFWWQGGYQGQGRIPRDRLENGHAPIPVTTPMDVAREEWIELFRKARSFADKESWKRAGECPRRSAASQLALRHHLPHGTSGFSITAPERLRKQSSSRPARTIAARRSRASRRPGLPLISMQKRRSTTGSKPAGCIWRSTRNWSSWSLTGG
jgi:hypothetical protein